MYKNAIGIILLAGLVIGSLSSFVRTESEVGEGEKIKWYTWEEAMAANEKEPRKFVIDVYTNWCHWCKVMDKKTFSKKKIIEYVNANFYPIKFNAEQRADINFQGHTFKYVSSGRRGYHQLAGALLDGRLSYPSIVYLNEKMERIMISPGYKDDKAFITELVYANEEHYKTTDFDHYKKSKK